jgi:hypothetical protein
MELRAGFCLVPDALDNLNRDELVRLVLVVSRNPVSLYIYYLPVLRT